MAKLRILGSGTSTGVPFIGCDCEVCTSSDRRDRRLRTSALYEDENVRILLDCGPDFRQQILSLPYEPIDAVLITHEHFDHVGGLDDLRAFSFDKELPIYTNQLTADRLKSRMPYCFVDKSYPGIPHLSLKVLNLDDVLDLNGTKISPVSIMHGRLPIYGYRINNIAYITDMLTMDSSSFDKLKDLDVLIINALRLRSHNTHQSLAEALAVIDKLKPQKAYLVHMSHDIGLHTDVQVNLPDNVFIAYDGMEFCF